MLHQIGCCYEVPCLERLLYLKITPDSQRNSYIRAIVNDAGRMVISCIVPEVCLFCHVQPYQEWRIQVTQFDLKGKSYRFDEVKLETDHEYDPTSVVNRGKN